MGSETRAIRAMLTVPNGLSVVRLLGVPVFLWLVLAAHADGWALLVLALSGFTDWLDGQLARAWNQTSRLGEILDPVADRLYIVAVLAGLSVRGIIPFWFVVLLLARDVVLLSCGPVLRRHGYGALPVHFLGKAATFNLLYAFPLLLLGGGTGVVSTVAKIAGWAFAIWGSALYWWAAVLYVVQVRQLVRSGASSSEQSPGARADPSCLSGPVSGISAGVSVRTPPDTSGDVSDRVSDRVSDGVPDAVAGERDGQNRGNRGQEGGGKSP